MFSQYSWWDFAKFVLVLAVPYYAFVLWKYYREDIREWISNFGQKNSEAAAAPEDLPEEEDQDNSSLYNVRNYASLQTPNVAEPIVEPELSDEAVANYLHQSDSADQSAELKDGVVLNDDQSSPFEVPLAVEVVRPQEQSLAEIIETAKGLVVDADGKVKPTDPNNKSEVKLSEAINKQKGNSSSVIEGISFGR